MGVFTNIGAESIENARGRPGPTGLPGSSVLQHGRIPFVGAGGKPNAGIQKVGGGHGINWNNVQGPELWGDLVQPGEFADPWGGGLKFGPDKEWLLGRVPRGAGGDGSDDGPSFHPAPPIACGMPLPAPDRLWADLFFRSSIGVMTGEFSANVAGNIIRLGGRATSADRETAATWLGEVLDGFGLSSSVQEFWSWSGQSSELCYEPLRDLGMLPGRNVYATLRATTNVIGAETIIIGAHYDSLNEEDLFPPNLAAPGANDNASGTAMVLALAHYLLRVQCRTRNVVFVLFDLEEYSCGLPDLPGSTAFVDGVVSPAASLEFVSIHSMHNIDQVGFDDDGDRVLQLEGGVAREVFEVYTLGATELGWEDRLVRVQGGVSDHVAFDNAGIRASGITEEFSSAHGGPTDTTPYVHTVGDSHATINFEYMVDSYELLCRVMGLMVRGA